MKNPATPSEPSPLLREKGPFRPLDGLRGVAILLVLLFHDFDYLPLFSFGWMGVDIFFVLSGLLITTTFLKDLAGPRPILLFYTKRILRIFPLYYLSLILLLLVLPLIVHNPEYILPPHHRPWFWLFLQNWMYILEKIPASEAPHLRHLWSLALEEQYYLIWPWILLLVRKPQHIIRIILGILAAVLVSRLIIWKVAGKDLTYYFFLCTRIEGLCIGSLLAVALFFKLPGIQKRLFIALGGTLAASLAIQTLRFAGIANLPFYGLGGYLLISLSVAILILYLTKSTRPTILSNNMLVLAGRISYGWYIFHWPLYLLLSKPIGNFLASHIGRIPFKAGIAPPIPYQITSSVICILLAGLLAYASYYNYETYFLKWKQRLSFSWKSRHGNVRPLTSK
jgi:peptidoglycan/LPS O-acetylase OafA/YrhL